MLRSVAACQESSVILIAKLLPSQVWSRPACPSPGSAGGAPVLLECDVEEGADETDEGGGKRLLRSHTAAAAADLDRENSVDRENWSD